MSVGKIYVQEYKSPVGVLLLGSHKGELVLADWKYRKMRQEIDKRVQHFFLSTYHEHSSETIERTVRQLDEYFHHDRRKFVLPLGFAGTEFQQRVWKALIEIPYGHTTSYAQLSHDLGDEKAIRAVASANGANAISIIVPCHRVIGRHGELVGYAGGLRAKRKLLDLESGVKQGELF